MTPRREFFRTGLRYAGLSALGVLGFRLSTKPGCRKPADPCCDCQLFSDCDLPKARQSKTQPDPKHA